MPQELTAKMMAPLVSKDEVRPFEKTTVYATGVGGFHTAGEALELHPLLATKLILQGAATEKAQEAKKEKEPAK